MNSSGLELAWILINPGESHPEQRGHGSSRESRVERCEDRKGFPRWGKFLSFAGTYPYPGGTSFLSIKKIKGTPVLLYPRVELWYKLHLFKNEYN